MSVLSDGRFVFTDAKANLYLESRAVEKKFFLLYGGRVFAYAFHEEAHLAALVCPLTEAVLQNTPKKPTDPSRSILKLYQYEDNTNKNSDYNSIKENEMKEGDVHLTELLDEVETPLGSSVMWVQPSYIIVSEPESLTSVMKLGKGGKLKLIVRDKGLFPFISMNLLGLLSRDPPFVHLWDVEHDKKVNSLALQARKGRRRRGRERKTEEKIMTIKGSCGSGNFAVIAQDDGVVSVLYISRNTARLLSSTTPLLLSHAGHLHNNNDISNGNSHTQIDSEGSQKVMEPLCTALSSSVVLVGVKDGGEIYKLKYKKEGIFEVEDCKRLNFGERLVAVGKHRCLVQVLVDKDEKKTTKFIVLPLASIQSTNVGKPAELFNTTGEEIQGEALLNESTKRKRRRQNRKRKDKTEGSTPGEDDNGNHRKEQAAVNILGRNYSRYGTQITIGVLLVGTVIALYLRKS